MGALVEALAVKVADPPLQMTALTGEVEIFTEGKPSMVMPSLVVDVELPQAL